MSSGSGVPFVIERNFNCCKAEDISCVQKQLHCFSKIYINFPSGEKCLKNINEVVSPYRIKEIMTDYFNYV